MPRSGCPASGVVGHRLRRHHERGGAQCGAGTDRAAGQDDSARTQRRALTEDHSIRPQDPVVEEVGLQYAAPIDRRPVLQRHEVRLRKPVALHPHAPADPGAECTQPQRHQRCARNGPGQPWHGHHLDEGVRQLVAPHERAPQRVLPGTVPAHEQPLRHHGHAPAAVPAQEHQPAQQPRPPAECAECRHGQHREPRRAEHGHDPAQLHQPARPEQPGRRVVGAALVAAGHRARKLHRGSPR